MMNRTLQYFKNIKFNPSVNKTIVNEGKKKMTIIANKTLTKKLYQHFAIRTHTTKSRPLSFNNGPFNQPPEPPFDNRWIIAATMICGTYFTIKK
jgi:hypothetical protein